MKPIKVNEAKNTAIPSTETGNINYSDKMADSDDYLPRPPNAPVTTRGNQQRDLIEYDEKWTPKTAFTPGPWCVEQRKPTNSYSSPQPQILAGDTNIADVRWNGHNAEHGQANARLIAAAPALYEALTDCLERLQAYKTLRLSFPLTEAKARAALDLVEGRQ